VLPTVNGRGSSSRARAGAKSTPHTFAAAAFTLTASMQQSRVGLPDAVVEDRITRVLGVDERPQTSLPPLMPVLK
jgi:hypothetical protein